ncbi:hypothetical protein ACHAW6_015233 [Cyclotella cf. meneghiniana]
MFIAKILLNSVISTPGELFMTMDILLFYLMTRLLRPEYIRIKLMDIPDKIIQQYGLRQKANKAGMIHMVISKGMHDLPQSGLLVNELPAKWFNKHGYV